MDARQQRRRRAYAADSSGTPTITVDNSTTTISAPLGGNQGLAKNGAGILILSGANLTTGGLTGTTTINAGTVDVEMTRRR